jgi:hypothetical protein
MPAAHRPTAPCRPPQLKLLAGADRWLGWAGLWLELAKPLLAAARKF